MTHKKKLFVVLAVLVALIFAVLWYITPRTAEELYPEFAWDTVSEIDVTYFIDQENGLTTWGKPDGLIAGSSKEGQALISLLKDVEYRRPFGPFGNEIAEQTEYKLRITFYAEKEAYFSIVYAHGRLSAGKWNCFASVEDDVWRQAIELVRPVMTEKEFAK